MFSVRVGAILVLATAVCAGDAAPQGLGAVAARTADDRKASDGKSAPRLTDKDLPKADTLETELRDFLLTEEMFWKYVSARAWILDLRTKKANLDEYLLNAERAGTDPLTLEDMMTDQPQILECLDRETIAPREYTLTEVAYRRALVDAARSDLDVDRLPPTRAANARFLRKHDIQIRNGLSFHWGEKEKWLAWRRGVRR